MKNNKATPAPKRFSRHAILKASVSENLARLKDDRTSAEGMKICRNAIESAEAEVRIAVDSHASLLAALKELVEIVLEAKESNDGKERLDSFTCQPALAAISKAEGRE